MLREEIFHKVSQSRRDMNQSNYDLTAAKLFALKKLGKIKKWTRKT